MHRRPQRHTLIVPRQQFVLLSLAVSVIKTSYAKSHRLCFRRFDLLLVFYNHVLPFLPKFPFELVLLLLHLVARLSLRVHISKKTYRHNRLDDFFVLG
jgi:hypothetical protein